MSAPSIANLVVFSNFESGFFLCFTVTTYTVDDVRFLIKRADKYYCVFSTNYLCIYVY